MNDAGIATALMKEIAGSDRQGVVVHTAAKLLRKLFPHDREPHKQWTERRLLAWWKGESETVRFWQMKELAEAAEAAKRDQKLLEDARNEHREFVARTARMAAFLEHQDSTFYGDQIEAMRQQIGGVHLPRDS